MKPLGSILSALLREHGLEGAAVGWKAVADWPAVAGPRLSKHTKAASFRDGILTIEVEGSAWMHELGFLKLELVRRVNQHLGTETVRDVRFVLARGGNLR